jgi:hypothetical protein
MKAFFFIALLVVITLCYNKNKTETEVPKKDLEKLHSVTQTGANTFNCLVNGVAWLPNGTKQQNGEPNIVGYIDPTFPNGHFNISAHMYTEPLQIISAGSLKCKAMGYYSLDSISQPFDFIKNPLANITSVEFTTPENGTYRKRFLNISS